MESNLEATMGDGGDLWTRVLAQSGCGTMVTDNEGKILYVNPRFCKITGYSPAELIGKNPKILQSGETNRETYLQLWNTVSSGRPWRGVIRNRRKNGELYWESITISPLVSGTGEITHFSAMVEDITAEKSFEELQAKLEAESFEASKRESLAALAVGLAHDLNNALTGIIAGGDFLLRQAEESTENRELLRDVVASAQRAARIVADMAELSQRSLPEALAVDLRELTKRNLAHYDEAFEPPARLTWDPLADAPYARGNAGLIHEAIVAVLANAKEACPVGGRVVLATGAMTEIERTEDDLTIDLGLHEKPAVFVEVCDAGEGMSAEVLRRAFDPFFSTKRGHRGLGLANVSGIMRAHRGAICVKSSPEEGTRIRLLFPVFNQSR